MVRRGVSGDDTNVEFSTTDSVQQRVRVESDDDGTGALATERTDRTTSLLRSGYGPLEIRDAERNVLGLFTQVGALDHPMMLDLDEESLDMAAYVSDRCYRLVGPQETQECELRFGPYADLGQALRDGTFKDVLSEHFPLLSFTGQRSALDRIFDRAEEENADLDADDDRDMNQGDTDDDQDTDVMGAEDSGTELQDYDARSDALWDECETLVGTTLQAACCQDNLRLLDTDNEIPGNVYFRVQ